MAITVDQLKLRRHQIAKIIHGFDTLGFNSREVSLSKTALQKGMLFTNAARYDIDGGTDRTNLPVAEYNFSSHKTSDRIAELAEDMASIFNMTLQDYKTAGDTVCEQSRGFLLPTHLITIITSVEEAILWITLEMARKELENEG